MRRTPFLALAALTLVACGGASEEESTRSAADAAAEPAPAASRVEPAMEPIPTHAAPPAASTATQPAAVVSPAFAASGTASLNLDMTAPFELAGFELHFGFAAGQFKAGQPIITEQLKGFLCAANSDLADGFKYICASVPARRVEGRLATIPISWSARPPELSDLVIDKLALVDVDAVPAPEGVELRLNFD